MGTEITIAVLAVVALTIFTIARAALCTGIR
jgi:hypothetical protein